MSSSPITSRQYRRQEDPERPLTCDTVPHLSIVEDKRGEDSPEHEEDCQSESGANELSGMDPMRAERD
jgi:hypothetical protein